MLDVNTLVLFTAACLALVVSPGPDMLLIASRSADQGRAAGFATLAGIQVGTYLHALAAAMGLSQIVSAVPMVYDAIRYAGAAYLLYLAWLTWRSAGTPPVATHGERSRSTTWQTFREGLVTNVLNPKMALFVLALFPQFVAPERGSMLLQMLLLATIINLVGFVVNGTVILAASRARDAIAGSNARWPAYFLSVVFVALAARLLVSPRPT